MIRAKYISKAKRERQAFRQSQPIALPIVGTFWRKVFAGGREVLNLKTVLGKQCYQIRTELMAERQYHLCGLCGFVMTRPTFDHANGRCAGRRDDRIELQDGTWINAAVCFTCNGEKGSKRVPYLPHAKGPQ